MKFTKVFSIFCMFTSLSACSVLNVNQNDKQQVTGSNVELAIPISEALENTLLISSDISEGFLLRSFPDFNKTQVIETLYQSELALRLIQKNPLDEMALDLLNTSLKSFESFNYLNNDKYRFDQLIEKYKLTISLIADLQGRKFEGLEWNQFNVSFGSGLEVFSSWPEQAWVADSFKDKSYAYIKGTDQSAWLLSPILDLSKAENTSLQIAQVINNFGSEWQGMISVKISDNFLGGDPDLAQWEEIDIENLPLGNSYSEVTSEPIDLSRYEGSKIVIGFHYQTRSKSPIWQINQVRISSAGILNISSLEANIIDKNELFKLNFGNQIEWSNLTQKHRFDHTELPLKFGYHPQYKTASISGFNKGSQETWMISPKMDFSQVEEASVKLKHSLKFHDLDELTRVSVLYDVDENNIDLDILAKAKPLKFVKFSKEAKSSKLSTSITNADLSEFIGYKDVRFIFYYRSYDEKDAAKSPTKKRAASFWILHYLKIIGKGNLSVEAI